VKIEEEMDAAKIPLIAQRETLASYRGGEELRSYIREVRNLEPEGINFVVATDFKKFDTQLTQHEARQLVWVFAKELILSYRKVQVLNGPRLAERLMNVSPWEDEFEPSYADHLILTNFFRSGQDSPYTAKEVDRLVNYMGDRMDYGKTTHCLWETRSAARSEMEEWYSDLWLDFWFEENQTFAIKRK